MKLRPAVVPQCPSKRGLMSSLRERPLEQGIIPQIDLPDRQVVGGKPIFVKLCDFFGSE